MRHVHAFSWALPVLSALTISSAFAQTTPHAHAAATPEARAASRAATAAEKESEAAGEWPPLEVMLEIWQVPLKRPYAIDDAGMIRIAVEQQLQAPGASSALKRAGTLRAQAMRADGDAKGRSLALRWLHASLDHESASRSHDIHLAHLKVAEKTLTLARARHAAGGALGDVTMAEIETARAEALVAADDQRATTSRELAAALGGAGPLEATRERPELVALKRARDSELAQAEAERKLNGWPAPRVGASYFPPSGGMTEHSYGITLGMMLPWLWGARSGAEHAAEGRAQALTDELAAKQRDLALEVVQARGAVNAAKSQLTVLRQRVLPATTRARELAQSAYESGQSSLSQVLQAEAAYVDTQMEIIELENELAHRSVDLDFALGRAVTPRAVGAEQKP